MKNQQDSSKGKINFNLMYDGNYKDYFQWILNGSDTYEKTKLDLLTFKNTKHLLYRFNDLLESTSQRIKLIGQAIWGMYPHLAGKQSFLVFLGSNTSKF